jgi:Raf kinase inhibitor-like YbhB/YbcL family protein
LVSDEGTVKKIFSATLIIFLAVCSGTDKGRSEEGLILKSPAFKYGRKIPRRYTCDGENISPEFIWTGVPANAKSLVLIFEDLAPESNLFVHWVVYDIPPASKGLLRNVPHEAQLPDGSRQAYNTRSQLGYLGPCPGNETHRYVFGLYALDMTIEKSPPPSGRHVIFLMENHIIAKALYLGIYR